MHLTRRFYLPALITGVLVLGACVGTPTTAPPAPPRVPAQVSSTAWEQDVRRFEAMDAQAPPAKGAVLFIGSSSIRRWDTLADDFPQAAVINRGFGGSELRASTWYAGRLVIPHAPRQVLLYAGENDLHGGRSPAQVRDDFRAFILRLRRDLPAVRIAYLSIKPSPARRQWLGMPREANALLRAEAQAWDGVAFIDVSTPMLDAQGRPRESLFVEDRLHLNPAGYALWKRVITPYLR